MPHLVKALTGDKAAVRDEALHALAGMGPTAKDAVPALKGLLLGKDAKVSMAAAQALAKIGKDALPALADAIKSGDAAVRTNAVQGLAAMYRATDAKRYHQLALTAAAWFYGRNEARTAMYDPTTGRCRDGIQGGVASINAGAESSIEAGIAELERRDLLCDL